LNPLVSIIIPTYNRATYLGETLQSVLQQTWNNWECIIIDDRSSDYTDEIMEFYCEMEPRIRYFKRPSNRRKGANACRNYGFELSKGEYINWFDSDDIMHPEFIKKKGHALNQNDCICCISKIQQFSYQNGELVSEKTSSIQFDNLLKDLLLEKIAIPTPNPMWKRKYLEEINLFDEELKQSQDLELYSRIFYKNSKIQTIDEVLFFMRIGHKSISSDFYVNMPVYLNSFLDVRKRIIDLTKKDKEITNVIIAQVLGVFRYLLAKKEYTKCEQVLRFISENSSDDSIKFQIELKKINFFYSIFKRIGRGETRFKKYLYLSR